MWNQKYRVDVVRIASNKYFASGMKLQIYDHWVGQPHTINFFQQHYKWINVGRGKKECHVELNVEAE